MLRKIRRKEREKCQFVTIKRGKTGNVYYTWEFDLILLAGLTELKAQISWTDSVTVSAQSILPHSPSF